ncbi:MAG TPA: GMC family oxidoreductase [Bdellovibrionota bacterium]|nr:GMC family oxidoreductase [Bdellovibrionota bacterium]
MYDFAIIGSGVSGGRIAHELTAAGARCVLLEAGREYGGKGSPRPFPSNEMDYSTQLFWGGGLELSSDGRLGVLRARCLGGTSIVNQALLDRFDDLAWDDWRARTGIGWMSVKDMEPHYAICEETLDVSEVPNEHYGKNARIFTRALEKQGYGWKALHRAQRDCQLEKGSDCIVCLGGCPRDSKQSSLVTTIRWARKKGLEVRSEFEVDHVDYGKAGIRVLGSHEGREAEVTAGKVVLAAGALGNSRILLRSNLPRKLPAVGTRFSCHPQFMTYAVFDEQIDAHKGAFQAVKSDDRKLREAGYKLENVYAPPIGTAMLMPGFGPRHHALMRKYRHMASMEVALRDEASGRIRVSGGKLVVDKKLTANDERIARSGLQLVRELFEAAGAREIIACDQGFGLHLMGGCPLGTDGGTSVVDPEFQVHEHPGLYAADSSVFPAAPGINPSFTVMALSARAAKGMLK